jgi:hypothetical protein
MDLPVKGDRIELVEMGLERDGRPDPHPIEAGATGTVHNVVGMDWYGEKSHHISVDWDEHVGRTLSLVCPPDTYRIIERVMD